MLVACRVAKKSRPKTYSSISRAPISASVEILIQRTSPGPCQPPMQAPAECFATQWSPWLLIFLRLLNGHPFSYARKRRSDARFSPDSPTRFRRVMQNQPILSASTGEKTYLLKLGFRRPPKRTLAELFRPTSSAPKPQLPIRPDTDYPQYDQRTEQAPAFSAMWIDHFRNYGNIHNPLGSPMESGA